MELYTGNYNEPVVLPLPEPKPLVEQEVTYSA
jgi:hypothetical protein